MKKRYKKEAYYLDDGILLHGYVDKRGFHTEHGLGCGFSLAKINKHAIRKTVFYSLRDALNKLGEIQIVGGKFIAGIDDGLYVTKVRLCGPCNMSQDFATYTLVEDGKIEPVIVECLNSIGIKTADDIKVNYFISSECQNWLSSKWKNKKHEVIMSF